MKNTDKAVAYCRTASTEQKDDLLNYQEQIAELKNRTNLEIVKWFKECSSGYGSRSAVLQKALKYCKNHEISHLIVSRPDRISRSLADYCYWEQAFLKNGVHIHFVQNAIQDHSPTQRFMDLLTIAFAEYDRENRSARVKRGLRRKKLQEKQT